MANRSWDRATLRAAHGIELPPLAMLGVLNDPVVIRGNQVIVSVQGPWHGYGFSATSPTIMSERYRSSANNRMSAPTFSNNELPAPSTTVEEGAAIARAMGIAILAILDHRIGLNEIARLQWLQGAVNAEPDFSNYKEVIDGCRRLFQQVFWNSKSVPTLAVTRKLPLDLRIAIKCAFIRRFPRNY